MMRYWKLISIVVVIVLVIGAFYIQSAMVVNSYPRFVLNKKSGDDQEVKTLMIQGDYRGRDSLAITSEGTKYDRETSFLQRIEGTYADARMKQLQKKYRQFMRGKLWDQSMLYDGKKQLIHADVQQGTFNNDAFTFEIEMLDKTTKKISSFKVPVPDKENKYSQLYVEDVQVSNGEIIVFTQMYTQGNDLNSEIHAYRFNIDDQKLVSDETIISVPTQAGNKWIEVSMLSEYDRNSGIEANKYVVYLIEHMEEVYHNRENDIESKSTGIEIVVYDTGTNQYETQVLPKEMQEAIYSANLNGSEIDFYRVTDSGIEVISYNIDKQKSATKQLKQPAINPENEILIEINSGKVYIAYPINDRKMQPEIFVVDLHSGDLLYEGLIEAENKKEEKYSELYLNHMSMGK